MDGRFCAVFRTGNTNGWMLWHYQTDHEPADILRPHYFDHVAAAVADGDWIACNLMRADAPGYHAVLLIVQRVGPTGVVVERVDSQAMALGRR